MRKKIPVTYDTYATHCVTQLKIAYIVFLLYIQYTRIVYPHIMPRRKDKWVLKKRARNSRGITQTKNRQHGKKVIGYSSYTMTGGRLTKEGRISYIRN